ncbi:hypothetical protein LTR53_005790 [Teratosphaeriaceae sp. CCFEE 6253]|nr:hypothetical protein LTR53_005790 [Teratosphaeriaceae sp. CCFEE 6253]
MGTVDLVAAAYRRRCSLAEEGPKQHCPVVSSRGTIMVNLRSSQPSAAILPKARRTGRTTVRTRQSASREAARLAIDGTQLMSGTQKAARTIERTYKAGGAYWADAESESDDNIVVALARKERKGVDVAASTSVKRRRVEDGGPARSRRKRSPTPKASEAAEPTVRGPRFRSDWEEDGAAENANRQRSLAVKQEDSPSPSLWKQKAEINAESLDDAASLRAARSQLRVSGRDDAQKLLPFLRDIKAPASQYTRHQYPSTEPVDDDDLEAYDLTAEDARVLLASNEPINAPVFVTKGANTGGILDPASKNRPIDQVFSWFTNPNERPEDGYGTDGVMPTISELRERFQTDGPLASAIPWNFADVPHPFPHNSTPPFLQQPSCNLLRDIMRLLLDCEESDICSDACPNARSDGECCRKHFLTLGELLELTQCWRRWDASLMLAEAGALTPPHTDRYGLGTCISCLEGAIGYGYLPRPSDADAQACLAGTVQPGKRWRFRVLRPGDAVYSSPGTPHLVFRLPRGGGQTLGVSVQVVRRVDVGLWVRMLELEARSVAHDEKYVKATGEVMRGLGKGLRWFLEHVMGEPSKRAVYGGARQLARLDQGLRRLEKVANGL